MDIRTQLSDLGRNLYWMWHPDASHIFRDLNPDLWRDVNHNPVEFLAKLSDQELKAKAADLSLEARITRAFHILRDYVESGDGSTSPFVSPLSVRPVAYFSAEFGLHESLPIYSGGLGVLAGDHMKAASDLGIPIIGVGLLYAKGYFRQTLDANGWQHEDYSAADVEKLPIHPITDPQGRPIRIRLELQQPDQIWVRGWTARVGRCRLILVDTNVDENPAEARELTAHLYGGGNEVRIRQELVLGVGGMRMLAAMGIHPGVIHLNEGHSAFALLELARALMVRDGQAFGNIQELVAAMSVFTTHTPVPAGHDRFDPDLTLHALGALRQQLGLSERDLLALGRINPDDANEPFCMTVLGLKLSRSHNAVSHLHARVSRSMWRGVWPQKTESEVPIGYVTNGVHLPSWLASEMDRLYSRFMPEGWWQRLHDPAVWAAVDRIDDEELWETNQILQTRLVEFVRRRVREQYKARGEPDPTAEPTRPYLQVGRLTVGFARRFAEYKRGGILMQDMDRLDRLVNNPAKPVQFVFAGKAHPANDEGKRLIQQISQATRDPRFAGRIVFIEDYDINVARHLVQGVDVWLNTPRRPLEACGTSGMKAVLNGALNVSVLDGWWAEAYDGTNGFAIGHGSEHSNWDHQDQIDIQALYRVLEDEVVPMYYDRCPVGIPRRWIRYQKNALRTLVWRFNAQRMVSEYARECYLPAVGGLTSSFRPG